MSSSLSLPLNPYTFTLHHKSLSPPSYSLSSFPVSNRFLPFLTTTTSSLTHASISPPNPADSDPEERQWLREEHRWLREEQRWLREERRWCSERESLLREISELKLKIQALEHQGSVRGASVSETLAKLTTLLQILKDADSAKANWIAETGLGAKPMVLESEKIEEVVRVSGGGSVEEKMAKKKKKNALRKGSEGEDVRVMQVCSQYAFVLPE